MTGGIDARSAGVDQDAVGVSGIMSGSEGRAAQCDGPSLRELLRCAGTTRRRILLKKHHQGLCKEAVNASRPRKYIYALYKRGDLRVEGDKPAANEPRTL